MNTSPVRPYARIAMTLAIFAGAIVNADASTFYGGFEDTIHGDYDYNDIVFSLSSPSLSLISSGVYRNKPVLNPGNGVIGQTSSPFWNNTSSDGNSYNVGYCIYGGGNCNGGTAINAEAKYLAAAGPVTLTSSANDVVFSVDGQVNATVILGITSASDVLGWYRVSDPATVTFFTGNSTNKYAFNPGGNFGLVGRNNSSGNSFYSNTSVGINTADDVSHFAFFAAPEPGTWALLGSALAGLAAFRRKMGKRA